MTTARLLLFLPSAAAGAGLVLLAGAAAGTPWAPVPLLAGLAVLFVGVDRDGWSAVVLGLLAGAAAVVVLVAVLWTASGSRCADTGPDGRLVEMSCVGR